MLPRARSLTDKPILLRLDSAHDARANRDFLREQTQVDFLIKWNPRKEDPLAWADKAQTQKAWTLERDGKMEAVLSFATLGYNVLRWMGLRLTGLDAPVRHPAKRRRLRTVMQELMTLACRLVRSGRQWALRFGRHCPGFIVYRDLYRTLASSG